VTSLIMGVVKGERLCEGMVKKRIGIEGSEDPDYLSNFSRC
jgi:hypothetical protein